MNRFLVIVAGWMFILIVQYGHPASGQIAFEETPHWNAKLQDNFFREGELRQRDERGYPKGWDQVDAFDSGDAVMLDEFRGVVQLKCPAPQATDSQPSESEPVGNETSISATIDLPKGAKFITFLTRMRGPTVVLGDSERAGAGMVYGFIRRDGTLRELPRVEPIYHFGSLGGWKMYRSTARILPGEKQVVVQATIEDAKGEFEVDRVLLVQSEPGYQANPDQIDGLRRAIASDDADAIRQLIEGTPELLEYRNGLMDNGTPLILASWYNSPNVARELVRLGADMEASDESWGNTPLAWCCWWGNAEVAEVMVQAGADLKEFDRMAENCKTNNKYPRGTMEDFDRIIQCVVDAKAKAAEK